jgi:hypothetical protein
MFAVTKIATNQPIKAADNLRVLRRQNGEIADHLTDLRGNKSLCYGFGQALIDARIHISIRWRLREVLYHKSSTPL